MPIELKLNVNFLKLIAYRLVQLNRKYSFSFKTFKNREEFLRWIETGEREREEGAIEMDS